VPPRSRLSIFGAYGQPVATMSSGDWVRTVSDMLTLITTFDASRADWDVVFAAVDSWLANDCVETVVLFGPSPEQLPQARARVVCVPFEDLPRLPDILSALERTATSSLVGYINSDILLHGNLGTAIRNARAVVGQPPMLLTGWRINIEKSELPIRDGARIGQMSHGGMDYFIYDRGLFRDFPPMFIGRGYWDYTFVERALQAGTTVVNCSAFIKAYHVNHAPYGIDVDYHRSYLGPHYCHNRKEAVWWRCLRYPLHRAQLKLDETGQAHATDLSRHFKWIPEYLVGVVYHVLLALHPYSRPLMHYGGRLYRKLNEAVLR